MSKQKFEINREDGGLIVNSLLDDKGAPMKLTKREASMAAYWENHIRNAMGYQNDLGFQVDITTLTAISKRISEQKYAGIAFADYMPVVVGEGAWSTEILKYRTFAAGDNFEKGIMNTASDNSKFAKMSAAVDAVHIPIKNWGGEINYSIFEIEYASRSGNWDLVESLERSRKTNWDLGIQKVSFLGMDSDTNIKGLLNLSGITSNTALITKYVSSMNTTEFSTFTQGLIDAYRQNCSFTAYPAKFIMPELDYNGLVSPVSPDFPMVSKLTYLLDAFKAVTNNRNFEILPCFYADQANNATVSGLNKNRYVLETYDQDSFNLNIPVQYTTTQQNTFNGAQWQNVGYGQFTGVTTFRPAEILYLDF